MAWKDANLLVPIGLSASRGVQPLKETIAKRTNTKTNSKKMKKITYILSFLCLVGYQYVAAQVPTPAPPQSGAILLYNGVAHIGNGEVVENAVIGFEEGKITVMGTATITGDGQGNLQEASKRNPQCQSQQFYRSGPPREAYLSGVHPVELPGRLTGSQFGASDERC